MEILKIKGIYSSPGKIQIDKNYSIDWKDFSEEKPPHLPLGSSIDIIVSFDYKEFLSGNEGIVWATYDLRQAEIIQSALLAQHISSDVKNFSFGNIRMFQIHMINSSDVLEAINFIWKDKSGLMLKPDWNYPEGESNKSFELWVNEQ